MKYAISVERARGYVTIDGLVTLTPRTRVADIAPLMSFLNAKYGPATFNFAGLSFEGLPAFAQLIFADDKLSMVSWSAQLPDGPATIDDVTPAHTQAEIAFMRLGLMRQIGYPQTQDEMVFPWGGVHCCRDPKTQLSSCGLRWI